MRFRESIKAQVDWANSLNQGQFHLFDEDDLYVSSLCSFEAAKVSAEKNGLRVFNDSARIAS